MNTALFQDILIDMSERNVDGSIVVCLRNGQKYKFRIGEGQVRHSHNILVTSDDQHISIDEIVVVYYQSPR